MSTFKGFITSNLLVYFPYICEKPQQWEAVGHLPFAFGEEKVYAYKVILSSVSGVSSAAFES
jgi:hypothetical protein